MKVESSIKESYTSTTTEPIKNIDDIINIICEWNGISLEQFKEITWNYVKAGVDNDWNPLYLQWDNIINPIGKYLMAVYNWKDIVFEKGNDKFFWIMYVRMEDTKYMLWDKAIDIPFRMWAENELTGERIIIFPKTSDIVQKRMRWLYVVNTGWADRQRLEKELMAKMIELAQVRGWNEIISTQNTLEEMKTNLKKEWIDLQMANELLYLDIPWRKVRDTNKTDNDYIAPPIKVEIDFLNKSVKSKGYSSHWFGTPSSWWNPCWGNRDNEIYNCLQDCNLKSLVNLIISWAYGFNSRDTWTSHDWRHPVAKLRDYLWYLNDNKDKDSVKNEIELMKQHLEDVKKDLELDNWLQGCSTISNFISSLEKKDETAE